MTAALVLAGGAGIRMGGSAPKVLLPLAGRPALYWTLLAFQQCPDVDLVCVVTAPALREELQGLFAVWKLDKVRLWADGGAQRGDSVRNGLEALPRETEWVAVHDGARPLVVPEDISRVLAAAKQVGGAVLGHPVSDTLHGVDEEGFVSRTPSRSGMWHVQTPQCFAYPLLLAAYRKAAEQGFTATDDTAVFRFAGHKVLLVRGRTDNYKLTYPGDVPRCEIALRQRGGLGMRVGMGYDVHQLVPERALVLGGVTIPYHMGLLGHSDADVLVHAVMDAILGAAALGDIGQLFPDTSAAYAGANSLHLLEKAVSAVREAGYQVVNVDATVVCQQPKIAPYREAMAQNLAHAMGIEVSCISIKGTTTEGLGFTGRGEGIASQAVALLERMG